MMIACVTLRPSNALSGDMLPVNNQRQHSTKVAFSKSIAKQGVTIWITKPNLIVRITNPLPVG